jgi:hypothetical protein
VSSSALLESYFHHDGAGFMSLFLGKDNMTATFYDETGAQLYSAHTKRKYVQPHTNFRTNST